MEISMQFSIWDRVLELTKLAQENGSDPLLWAIHLSSQLSSAAVSLPSFELANLLVSYICWENNVPIAWKFLEKAFVFKILPPLPTLSLLSIRVIPNRNSRPAAFRLYMELLKGHALTFRYHVNMPNFKEIRNSLNDILNYSRIFGLEADEPGVLFVEIVFSIVWQLLDASLDDEGILQLTPEKKSIWPTKSQEMDIECKESLKKANTTMAIELIGCFLQNKVTSRILYLARQNMPVLWRSFIQRIMLLKENSMTLRNSKVLTPEALLQLVSDNNSRLNLPRELPFARPRFLAHRSDHYLGLSRSSLWLPLDLVLEDAMHGSHVNAESAVEIITGLVKSLQAVHGSTWHDTFLGLWKAALYLVQRERDPIDGPVPHLDTRLSMLLSITTLVVADLIEDEEGTSTDKNDGGMDSFSKNQVPGNRRMDMVSCLQSLGDYQTLLKPPHSVITAANQAAAKARMFVSGVNCGSTYVERINLTDLPIDFSGNLRHLIVEACIARNLLDTSAYFWPGYVNGSINQMSHTYASQGPSWSSFMQGAPLSPVLTTALVSAPASSFAEIEKIFEIAVKGSDDERIAAASILCGATLVRGWNVQEHTVYFIARLLSPPAPVDCSGGNGNHLISYAPVLNVLIVGIAPVDCFQIFSLHGLVPQLACSLMTICEVFGSCIPDVSWKLTTGEEISAHAVFSNAFALLLKLWRFNHPPLEYRVGDVPPVGCQLTPEFLLLARNSLLVTSGSLLKDPNRRRLAAVATASNPKPIFVDSFPKLKVWYRQHQACIASTLSGLVNGTPVHQTVDTLLNMMFRKVNRANQSVISVASGSSSSSVGTDDSFPRPILPAWDILEAVPFVVNAALTACDHGRLSPRELCTGLKDLADYLPASLATIVSYFSAEVTRGVWKPVFMNGTDWPSPAANLSNVEKQIKKILAATGVDIPSLAAGESSPSSLPLPLAAFVSLTITYKLDKASQRFLNLAGPALESLAAGCPWPCMAIVASLWTQKAKRWSDFLVFSASRTVFLHNNDAVVQLLKSCFMATLGLSSTSLTSNGGVGSLLGHGFGSHFDGGISPVAPGILYLRAYRDIRDIMFLREEIVNLLMECIRDTACCDLPKGTLDKLKNPKNSKYGHASLAKTMTRVKMAASLGASIVWLTGGMGMVQSLIIETLPPWFLSVHQSEQKKRDSSSSSMGIPMLRGYALAYFVVFSGSYAWGVDSNSIASKRRPTILGCHMEFVANVLHGKISLGCNLITWRAYVVVLLSLMIDCMPTWIRELEVRLLERLSQGLLQWREEELALALLGAGGIGTMGIAAEMIMDSNP